MKSCEKRPISYLEVEKCVERIEKKIRNTNNNEVSSNDIGEIVMEELMNLDQVAYVRFASVYREFTDINQLMDALKHLDKGETIE